MRGRIEKDEKQFPNPTLPPSFLSPAQFILPSKKKKKQNAPGAYGKPCLSPGNCGTDNTIKH